MDYINYIIKEILVDNGVDKTYMRQNIGLKRGGGRGHFYDTIKFQTPCSDNFSTDIERQFSNLSGRLQQAEA